MSTDYGLYCVTCNDRYIIEDCRRPDPCYELLQRGAVLADIRMPFKDTDIDIVLHVHYEKRVDISFFENHKDHTLEVIDEYGSLYPPCKNHWINPIWCKLKENHAGECRDTSVFNKKTTR